MFHNYYLLFSINILELKSEFCTPMQFVGESHITMKTLHNNRQTIKNRVLFTNGHKNVYNYNKY